MRQRARRNRGRCKRAGGYFGLLSALGAAGAHCGWADLARRGHAEGRKRLRVVRAAPDSHHYLAAATRAPPPPARCNQSRAPPHISAISRPSRAHHTAATDARESGAHDRAPARKMHFEDEVPDQVLRIIADIGRQIETQREIVKIILPQDFNTARKITILIKTFQG